MKVRIAHDQIRVSFAAGFTRSFHAYPQKFQGSIACNSNFVRLKRKNLEQYCVGLVHRPETYILFLTKFVFVLLLLIFSG